MADETSWRQSIYDQLHQIAQFQLNHEANAHSIQSTLLADDAYLKLLKQRNVDLNDPVQVRAVGANIIRRLLIDHARKRRPSLPLRDDVADKSNFLEMTALDDALKRLAALNPRAGDVAEIKIFGDLTGEEIAQHLQISPRTVATDWRFAKAWLYHELGADSVRDI